MDGGLGMSRSGAEDGSRCQVSGSGGAQPPKLLTKNLAETSALNLLANNTTSVNKRAGKVRGDSNVVSVSPEFDDHALVAAQCHFVAE